MVHYSKSETRNCIASIDDAKLEAVVLCIESSFPNLSDHSGGWVGIFLLHLGNFRIGGYGWRPEKFEHCRFGETALCNHRHTSRKVAFARVCRG